MRKKLTISQWINLKTQKCTNPQCPTGQLFSNQVRARYYQLVFLNDKCCFGCHGYHTEKDRRRKMYDSIEANGELKKIAEYSPQYLIDFSCFQNLNFVKHETNANKDQNPELFGNKCRNLVDYLYHPSNYKKLDCPFSPKQTDQTSDNKKLCDYLYCPFLHRDQTIDPQLERLLDKLKTQMRKSEGLTKSNLAEDKKTFQDKLLKIMILRSCKPIDEFYEKEMNLLAKDQYNTFFDGTVPKSGQKTPSQISAEDISEIQKIKQRLKKKAAECLKIDKQQQTEQHSRKVVYKNFSKEKDKKNITKSQLPQQCQNDDLGISFNYFKYGQKVPLIEGRTIEFKHFKDISEASHIPLIMRYIAAFLNTEGGKLYIGIDDNSYAYGAKFKQSEYDKLLLKIDNEGKFYMTPPLMPQKYNIKLIPVYHDRKGEERWVIEIMVFPPKEQNKKLFLYNRECYMRMNASTHKLNASDIIELMSLNSENNASRQGRQDDLIRENEEIKPEKLVNEGSKVAENLNKQRRQNQLMSQTGQLASSSSKSIHKFQTEESRQDDFESKLKSKSIQDLYAMRKDYEQKLKIIMDAYKKKEREVR